MPVKPTITPPTWASAENNTAPYSFVAPDLTHQANGYFTNEKPASGPFNYVMGLLTAWVQYLFGLLPGVNANEVLVITSNSVTPTQGNSTFQTAGGTVNTVNVANLNAGNIWKAFGNGSNGTTLTYGDGGSGALNLVGATSVVLTSTNDSVTFQYNATTGNMDEIGRSANVPSILAQPLIVLTTPGTGTVTVPFGKTGLKATCVGGGGGGGGAGGYSTSGSSDGAGGGGGSGGAFQQFNLTGLVYGASVSYQLGAGGAGGAGGAEGSSGVSGRGGTSGSATWVGSSATGAAGGLAGSGGESGGAGAAGGPGGAAVSATVSSTVFGVSSEAAGSGGSSAVQTGGFGGRPAWLRLTMDALSQIAGGVADGGAGGAGSLYGGGASGGGGAQSGTTTGGTGGTGANGILIIEWI